VRVRKVADLLIRFSPNSRHPDLARPEPRQFTQDNTDQFLTFTRLLDLRRSRGWIVFSDEPLLCRVGDFDCLTDRTEVLRSAFMSELNDVRVIANADTQ
jgi:hypothetical protein